MARDLDVIDALTEKSEKLYGLTTSLTGDGFRPFSQWNREIQHSLLWLAAGLAEEVNSLAHKLALSPEDGQAKESHNG